MALGTQMSPVQTLVTFCLWAKRNGYHVGEMHGFSTVNRAYHTAGSWHFDSQLIGSKRYGKAADINFQPDGPTERTALLKAVSVAQRLNLAVIYAKFGTSGVARSHQNHLHVDVGPYSHLGITSFRPQGGGDKITAALQHAVRTKPDQIWDADTEKRLQAVRMASRHHKNQFPYGVKYTQAVLGVTQDGKFGPLSWAAHLRAVANIQKALHIRADGVWGDITDSNFRYHRNIAYRR